MFRRQVGWVIPGAVVAVVVFAAIDALRSSGGKPPTASSEPNRAEPNQAAVTFSRRNRLDAESLAHFNATSERLDGELGALLFCFLDGEGPDCINDERKDFKAALSAAVDMWNRTGPESRQSACYRELQGYGKYLSGLDGASEALFAAADTGQAAALRGLAERKWEEHYDIRTRVFVACT
jgi:hypothetical protein